MDDLASPKEQMGFLRTLLQTNIHHIAIADNKAGLLLGANFIVVSFFIEKIIQKNFQLILCIPLICSFAIITYAIKTLTPKFIFFTEIPRNFLFFGDVTRDDYATYMKHIQATLLTSQAMHTAMLNDYYQSSLILNKKYQSLRICYRLCFIFSLCAGITVIFLIALI